MAKTIEISFEGKDYTLEYTRKSIELMERQGFRIADIQNKPMTTLPELFAGAFLAHHRHTKREIVNKIFGKLTNKDALIETLAEMYNEPLVALMDEPDDSEGNLEWKAI